MLQLSRTLSESAQTIEESIAKIVHSDEAIKEKEKLGVSSIQEKSNKHFVFHLDITDYAAEEVYDSFYDEFLELFNLGDSVECFFCDQCDGVELCVDCAKMDAYLMVDGPMSVDIVEKIHVTKIYVKEIVLSIVQSSKLELEFPLHEQQLGRFEYIYLKNDA